MVGFVRFGRLGMGWKVCFDRFNLGHLVWDVSLERFGLSKDFAQKKIGGKFRGGPILRLR